MYMIGCFAGYGNDRCGPAGADPPDAEPGGGGGGPGLQAVQTHCPGDHQQHQQDQVPPQTK